MVPRKLQKTDNLCGFYAFVLFKHLHKNLINVFDVHVLNFMSNFMLNCFFNSKYKLLE